ncbi:MAG: Rnf-Nqr domain containing protein [Oscillospiraceae bacterium]|nr:Rnf-Nqr domain containing protein [Oscillospiraceae bacterium]
MASERTAGTSGLLKRFKQALGENPVLLGGLALAPVVMVSTTVKNAVALIIVMACTLIPAMVLEALLAKYAPKVPDFARMSICALVAAAMLMPAKMAVAPLAQNIFDSLGMYLALTGVSALMFLHSPGRQPEEPLPAAVDAVGGVLGFALAALAVGAVREVFSLGTLWGSPMGFTLKFPAAAMPFAGFFAVAFAAAAWNGLSALTRKIAGRGAKRKGAVR